MVLEELLTTRMVEERPYLAFGLGFMYTFFGYLLARIFFPRAVSVSMLFLTTFFLVPTLMKLITVEERRERKEGYKHFFHNHKDVFETYFFTFKGVFVAYIVLGFMTVGNPELFTETFSFQLNFLEVQEGITPDVLSNFLVDFNRPSIPQLATLIANNMFVVIICFILSLLYGSSAVFLVMMNASVFSTFVLLVYQLLSTTLSKTVLMVSLLLIHLVPEIAGFLLAAIAGGVLSKAFMSEKLNSKPFNNVVKDATILLGVSYVLIVVAALLEAYVTTGLFASVFG